MYSLISGCLRTIFAKKEHSVIIVGLEDSGKTVKKKKKISKFKFFKKKKTLLEQIKHIYNKSDPPEPNKIVSTVGLNSKKKKKKKKIKNSKKKNFKSQK